MSGQAAPKPIAGRLGPLMREHKLRPEDLAADLHVSHRTVTRWVTGKTEPTPTLARALGVRFSVDWRSFYAADHREETLDPSEQGAE